jgi:serine/threonine-protein kinase RsbW
LKEKVIRQVYLKVPMIYDMELAVSKTAQTLAGFISFSQDQIDEITQALIEACINAIEHSKSKDRHIYIEFKLFADRIHIQVSDHGLGFDKKHITRPNLRRKLFQGERKRGWGLMLIRHYMDHIEIQSGSQGTRLLMVKRVSSPTTEGRLHE